MKTRLLVFLPIVLLLSPWVAHADVDVTQLYCEQAQEGSYDQLKVNFSLTNFSLPTAICDLHFVPEPLPAAPECAFLGLTVPTGWSGFLNPFGGGDFFANTPADCVAPGETLSGFSILITKPGICCYVVQYTDATGAVIQEEEVCFDCTVIGAETRTWGAVKGMYH